MALSQSATAQSMPVAALANPAAPAMAAAAPMAQPTAAAAATPALLLSQPNLIDRLLGAIGRCLASRDRPRVELVQMPALATVPMATQPTLMAPAPPAQPAYSLPSQPVYAAPPPEQARPLASPQSPPPQHWWHLFHRD
jgi:hypothetical protein